MTLRSVIWVTCFQFLSTMIELMPLALMTLQMIAICYIHREHFAWIDRGMEYPLVLLSVALLIAARGGGAWSLDGALAARRRSRAGQGAMRARPPWRD